MQLRKKIKKILIESLKYHRINIIFLFTDRDIRCGPGDNKL